MKSLKHYLTASVGLTLLVSAVALSLPQNGHSNSFVADNKDVRVVNTTAEPVPVVSQGTTNVAGSVNINNTPTVNAKQSGAWNVGITGTPTVEVGNSAANPVLVRDVDSPTAQPFQYQADVTLQDGDGGQNAFIPVPQGKLLVIEHVSAFGILPAEQKINTFAVLTHVAPDNAYRTYYLRSTKEELDGATAQYLVSQELRLYGDTPNIGVRITRVGAAGTATIRFVVSGYFVNKN